MIFKLYNLQSVMFGQNEIVGKKFFQSSKDEELLISNYFFTLQGEGPYRGYPAFFIRLAKCNLACSFCDTYFDQGDWMSFDTLLAETDQVIAAFFAKKNTAVPPWAQGQQKKMVLVITGGEPTLQSNVAAFLTKAHDRFQHTQIESNGIAVLSTIPSDTTLVVSPKCYEKAGKVIRYLNPNPKMLERANCLKFVLCAPNDSQYQPYTEIPLWAHQWAATTGKQLFISPMNIYKNKPTGLPNKVVSFWEPELLDLKINQRNHEYAAEYCLKHGFILNLQLHLFASLP